MKFAVTLAPLGEVLLFLRSFPERSVCVNRTLLACVTGGDDAGGPFRNTCGLFFVLAAVAASVIAG